MTAHTASFLRPFRFSSCACLLVAIIASEAHSKAQTSTFQPRHDFDLAAEFPRQDAMADFDHDGNLDLAVTNFGNGGGRVDVHFGDGQSDFSSSYEITLTNAECIGLGDFDADGWMDMAVGGTGWATQAVYVLRNDHLGGFVNMSTVYPLAWSPVGITTGDFNGDGHLDLAVVSTSSSAVLSWFAGNGSFGFSTFHLVPSTYNNTGERLISGDFDGDGLVDLVMSHTTGVRVFPNPGTGNFQNTFDLPITEHDVAIQAADVTGDGVMDLLVLSDSGHFSVWRGLGNATFTLQFETTPGGFTRDLSVGDLNRDGFLDVVMPTYSAFLILYGQSGGTFGNAQTVASGFQPVTCSVGDWNHDGWLDVAVSCNNAGGQAYLSVHEQIPHAIQSVCIPGTAGVVACPCGNTGLAGRGCANSIDASGALLTATGTSNPDTIVLHAAGMTLSASPASVLVQSTTVNTAGVAFGDGSRCVAGSLLRIGVKAMPSGTAQYPQAGDASISTKGFVPPGSGQTRFYQWYYRDSAISFCSAGTFNISNGVAVVW